MIVLKNRAGSSLAVSISAADTTLQIQAADAAKFPALEYPGDVFPLRLISDGGNSEYALATARDGANITVLRGQEGSTAQDFAPGTRVEVVVTAGAWDRLAESRWVRPKEADGDVLLPTYVDAASFQIAGDLTAMFAVNRALHLIQSAEAYGYVASASYAAGQTTVTVQGCAVDSGLSLVELGLEVEASPKYGNAANADTLDGSTKAQIVAVAQSGTSANASHLENETRAQILAAAAAQSMPLGAVLHSDGTNYNNVVATGFHVVVGNSSDTNTPFGASNSCTVEVIQHDANNITQVAVRLGADGLAYRRKTAGTWGSWVVVGMTTGLSGMRVFTAGGTWTVPDGVTAARVICVGGGGGSGATNSSVAVGGCGGGGGYSEKIVTGLTPGEEVTVTVGAGGTAGTSGGNGGAGGTSSFGSHVSAPGGAGGTGHSTTCGAGGIPTTTGALNIPGTMGEVTVDGPGYSHAGASLLSQALLDWAGSAYTSAVAGRWPGGGALGPRSILTNAYNGAAGAAGVVMIQY